MSSTPVTPSAPVAHPAPPITTPETFVQKIEADYSWFKLHLIALVLTGLFLYGGVVLTMNGVRKLINDHDAAVAAAQQKQEGVDTQTVQSLVAQLQNEQTENATRDAQQTALIQSLVAQMKNNQAATQKQVQVDQSADAASTATRLAMQTKASSADVIASNNSVIMALPVARTVTSDLDLLSESQSDVTNLQGQLQAQQILNNDSKVELQTANQTIAADKTELVQTVKADDAACTTKVNDAVTAQQLKDTKHNKIKEVASFVIGLALGLKY